MKYTFENDHNPKCYDLVDGALVVVRNATPLPPEEAGRLKELKIHMHYPTYETIQKENKTVSNNPEYDNATHFFVHLHCSLDRLTLEAKKPCKRARMKLRNRRKSRR